MASAKAMAQVSKQIGIGVAAGIVGGAVVNTMGEVLYSKNYEKYVDTIVKYSELRASLEPPKKGFFGIKLGGR